MNAWMTDGRHAPTLFRRLVFAADLLIVWDSAIDLLLPRSRCIDVSLSYGIVQGAEGTEGCRDRLVCERGLARCVSQLRRSVLCGMDEWTKVMVVDEVHMGQIYQTVWLVGLCAVWIGSARCMLPL